MSKMLKSLVIAAAGTAVLAAPAIAADKVRLVNSTKVVFETEHPYTALEEGIFKKHKLDVSIIHGSGGAASLQAVLTGSQDIVWGNGVLGVLSAYAKGAPVRILGSNIRGVPDLYWYVRSDSPIKSFKDLKEGQELAYSRPGSTTNLAAIFIKDALGLKAKLTSVGGPSGSRTQLMSGQVATGWIVLLDDELQPPQQLGEIRPGERRTLLLSEEDGAIGLYDEEPRFREQVRLG